eukprot:CAMPEP_0113900688 /NCGR_PEP_ID=MMETSP0780_2-20120614/20822_1 /TAXON_ID=652834 /ORGANISM="Palpitomonas bilix" /LENGTH=229 /DNA_ID=CAMNT_0000893187 /DNA_START=359 /DNA_END=1048 /DNA_ORIENTATION=+ /assembly_acc=CAM_ASM_000599
MILFLIDAGALRSSMLSKQNIRERRIQEYSVKIDSASERERTQSLLENVEGDLHAMRADEVDVAAVSRSSATLLWISLVLHSVLAGIALGTQTSLSTAVGLWIALIAHKGFAGFALGMKLDFSSFKLPLSIALSVLFAFTTPIGVIIGAAVEMNAEATAQLWVDAIVNGFASGTFIYVGVSEGIVKTFRASSDLRGAAPSIRRPCSEPILLTVPFVIGCSAMSALAIAV